MVDQVSKDAVKNAFSKSAHSNVDLYYEMIDKDFARYLEKHNVQLSDVERNRLKAYMWATVATENDRCKPSEERINHINTNMWQVPEVVQNKTGAHLKFKDVPLFQPGDGRYHLIGFPFDKYDGRMKNSSAGDGNKYRGRGFVQITGRENYMRYGPLAGIPALVEQPDLASDPRNASKILVAFILDKHNRDRILSSLAEDDLVKAREVVNGRNPHGVAKFSESYSKITSPSKKGPSSHPQHESTPKGGAAPTLRRT
jgi:hypothetical protein